MCVHEHTCPLPLLAALGRPIGCLGKLPGLSQTFWIFRLPLCPAASPPRSLPQATYVDVYSPAADPPRPPFWASRRLQLLPPPDDARGPSEQLLSSTTGPLGGARGRHSGGGGRGDHDGSDLSDSSLPAADGETHSRELQFRRLGAASGWWSRFVEAACAHPDAQAAMSSYNRALLCAFGEYMQYARCGGLGVRRGRPLSHQPTSPPAPCCSACPMAPYLTAWLPACSSRSVVPPSSTRSSLLFPPGLSAATPTPAPRQV